MDPQPAEDDDPIIAELLSMGFDISAAVEALRTEGIDSLVDAVEYLLAGGNRTNTEIRRQDLKPPLLDAAENGGAALEANSQDLVGDDFYKQEFKCLSKTLKNGKKEEQPDDLCTKAEEALSKHFGYSKIKPFQLEALTAWQAHQDCLVLAATGSGKSLCFQLPALLTGKVVIVISPLISLMHDQCLQLSRHGITACFLGSGQGDKSVERKAMAGMYSIVYVCPETLPRLIDPLKALACNRGIALFAIDEAHCISKWGHDFRPAYRQLSVLRETFQVHSIPGLKGHVVPILALTATATKSVQQDILSSLKINSSMARIVRMTLFRPNLRFSVRHSKTSKPSSYEKDFQSLIDYHAHSSGSKSQNKHCSSSDLVVNGIPISRQEIQVVNGEWKLPQWGYTKPAESFGKSKQVNNLDANEEEDKEDVEEAEDEVEDEDEDEDEDEAYQGSSNMCAQRIGDAIPGNKEQQELTVNFLEDDDDNDELERLGGDFEVAWNESLMEDLDGIYGIIPNKSPSSEKGPSIVYMPTRKETESLAKFLTQHGVKAAPYHAKLSKGHLRKVHEQFHLGTLQVVVATIAFGMGIDKPNVRHIIHYGWPQSLEAYYQEAGRAGRDGLLSECILYCDMTALPSLLPSRRDPEQTRHALCMLDQCFRYGVSTSKCRANTLLAYFGEDLANARCEICDVCSFGPPPLESLTKEAELLLTILSRSKRMPGLSSSSNQGKRQVDGNANRRTFQYAVEEIAEHKDITPRNRLWWRGFGRVLADAGFLQENNLVGRSPKKLVIPHLKNPGVTAEGQKFLDNCKKEVSCYTGKITNFCIYQEGDMIQAMLEPNLYRQGGKREWGRGWADPEIRKQRLSRSRFSRRKPRQKRQRRGRDRSTF